MAIVRFTNQIIIRRVEMCDTLVKCDDTKWARVYVCHVQLSMRNNNKTRK